MHCIDISDSDRYAKISLISAVFEYAYHQSRILLTWSNLIAMSGRISPILGKKFREDYLDMVAFYRHNMGRHPSAATELMEYIGMDSDEFWRKVGNNLAAARVGFEALGGVCVVCGEEPEEVAGMCGECMKLCQK